MTKLGVNIDHTATLRQVRYRGVEDSGEPNILNMALLCEKGGADGITAHLREDRRHIVDQDIFNLQKTLKTRLNLEMANTSEMIAIAEKVQPEFVCLVPEKREELTTEGGLNVIENLKSITASCERLQSGNTINVSLFIGTELDQVKAAADSGAKYIEIHTGPFAHSFQNPSENELELDKIIKAAELARQLGLVVNAGHGLNFSNTNKLVSAYPHFYELNIGHSIVAYALVVGMEQAVRAMKNLITQS